VQGFFPYRQFASEEEQAAVLKSAETAAGQTDFQQKQRATVIAHLKDSKSANLQLVLVAATPDLEIANYDQSRLFPPATDPTAPNGLTIALCLQYPFSRGHVHVKSSGKQSEVIPYVRNELTKES
jgi:hypothetical protein